MPSTWAQFDNSLSVVWFDLTTKHFSDDFETVWFLGAYGWAAALWDGMSLEIWLILAPVLRCKHLAILGLQCRTRCSARNQQSFLQKQCQQVLESEVSDVYSSAPFTGHLQVCAVYTALLLLQTFWLGLQSQLFCSGVPLCLKIRSRPGSYFPCPRACWILHGENRLCVSHRIVHEWCFI